jgi:hypothetical protein
VSPVDEFVALHGRLAHHVDMSGGDEPREMVRGRTLRPSDALPDLPVSKAPFYGEIQHNRQRHRAATFREQLPVLLRETTGLGRQDEIPGEVASIMTVRDSNDRALIFENPQMVDDAAQGYFEDTRKLPHMDPRLGRDRVQGPLSNVRLWPVGAVSASRALRHK